MDNHSEDSTHAVLKHDLSRFLPIRIVLNKDGEDYLGFVEHSFEMGFDKNHVRIWWSGIAYSFLGEHTLDGVKDAEYHATNPEDLIFDPLSDDCPIEVDWAAWRSATSKYNQRNAPFKMKTK